MSERPGIEFRLATKPGLLARTARALEGRHCPAKSFWCLDEATSSASRAADINHGGASLGEEAQLNARLTPLHV